MGRLLHAVVRAVMGRSMGPWKSIKQALSQPGQQEWRRFLEEETGLRGSLEDKQRLPGRQ